MNPHAKYIEVVFHKDMKNLLWGWTKSINKKLRLEAIKQKYHIDHFLSSGRFFELITSYKERKKRELLKGNINNLIFSFLIILFMKTSQTYSHINCSAYNPSIKISLHVWSFLLGIICFIVSDYDSRIMLHLLSSIQTHFFVFIFFFIIKIFLSFY